MKGYNINNAEKNIATIIEKTSLEKEHDIPQNGKHKSYTLSDCYNLAQ